MDNVYEFVYQFGQPAFGKSQTVKQATYSYHRSDAGLRFRTKNIGKGADSDVSGAFKFHWLMLIMEARLGR